MTVTGVQTCALPISIAERALADVRATGKGEANRAGALVRRGITRMYERGEDIVYYVTIYNENQVQPALP